MEKSMRTILVGISVCSLVLLCSWPASADEEKVPLDKVPKAVLDSVHAKFPDARLKGAEKEDENGATVYEVELTQKGEDYEITLTPDGSVVAVERVIPASALPSAVAKTLKERWPKAEIKKVEEITKSEAVSYEVAITVPRQGRAMKAEVTLDAQGKVLNWENPESKVSLSKLPPKVLASAKDRFPGAELLKAEKETEDGKVIFEITLNYKGQRLEAEFAPEGEYLEMEVSAELKDLPAAVTEALKEKYAGAKYRHAAKVTKKDQSVSYEVIVQTPDGKHGEVVVSPEGKILKGLKGAGNAGNK
jgi:uncharacterized membrane protein YkoI